MAGRRRRHMAEAGMNPDVFDAQMGGAVCISSRVKYLARFGMTKLGQKDVGAGNAGVPMRPHPGNPGAFFPE